MKYFRLPPFGPRAAWWLLRESGLCYFQVWGLAGSLFHILHLIPHPLS
jgi:hypothetical protein